MKTLHRSALWLWLGLILASACNADGERSMLLILPGMAESVPYDAYDPNPVTGQTLLHPPEGTVPYGEAMPAFEPGREEAERAGRELVNPVPSSEGNLIAGQKTYERFCLVCHGVQGEGDGPIIGRFPNPPSLTAPRARELPDGHIFHVISHGQGLMASYSAQIPPEDRWKLILYVRTLQAGQPTPQGETP